MFLFRDNKKTDIENAVSQTGSEAHVRYINISELENLIDIDCPRDTISLAINIKFFGILNPLNAYYDKHKGKYYLISGGDKLSALYLLGRSRVLCRVITDPITCDGILIDEYIIKSNQNLMSICTALKYLTETRGYSLGEISSMSGLSTTLLNNYMKIAEFSSEEKRLLNLLNIDAQTGIELAKIEDVKARMAVFNHIKQAKLTTKSVISKSSTASKAIVCETGLVTNSINKLVSKISLAGMDAGFTAAESDTDIIYTIRVAKNMHK